MPLPAALVGTATDPVDHEVDARWIMAHAASLGVFDPCHHDTTRPDPIVAHPLFPVAVEWPVVVAARLTAEEAGLTRDEARRSVHATHDLRIHRPVRAGDVLRTTATTVAVEPRTPGAYWVLELTTVDAAGDPVATTRMGSLFLGTTVDGEPVPDGVDAVEEAPDGPRLVGRVLALPAGLAHAYTEGSRIWNPIHTDPAVAIKAGLPEPILHGTATLALAVQELIDAFVPGRPELVRRVRCRFGAMVLLPSEVVVRAHDRTSAPDGSSQVRFSVAAADRAVLRAGVLDLAP